ncbi:MAG: hypothetical protein WCH43_02925 [Verrucomicrobiota bacterium]
MDQEDLSQSSQKPDSSDSKSNFQSKFENLLADVKGLGKGAIVPIGFIALIAIVGIVLLFTSGSNARVTSPVTTSVAKQSSTSTSTTLPPTSTVPTTAPPVTEPPTTAGPTVSSWALSHQAQVQKLADSFDNARNVAADFLSDPTPSKVTDVSNACTNFGLKVAGAINWTIPPSDARNKLLDVISAGTVYVRSCLDMTTSSTDNDLSNAMQGMVDGGNATLNAIKAFSDSLLTS